MDTIKSEDLNLSERSTIFEVELIDPSSAACSTKQPAAVYGAKYMPVAKRVVPVSSLLPEDFRIERRRPNDPLASMAPLPTTAPAFEPGQRYTYVRYEAQNLNTVGFMWPEEERLAHWIIRENEAALAWDETEKGRFSEQYFDPIRIPTVNHIPWVLKNIPIPPGIREDIIKILKDKIAAGTYEASNSSYRSAWFCVPKKDGKSLRLVHDLQPLNRVTIRDAAVPPLMDQMIDAFAGRACYGLLDLFVAFDQRTLDVRSRDMTTFQTPLGTLRLTVIPMGYTNAAQIMHGDVTYMLQDEIPKYTIPYIDDVPVRGPATRYELPDGSCELITANAGVRRFVYEHLQVMHRILHRAKLFGATFSGKKIKMCAPQIEMVGAMVSYEGRVPDQSRVKAIVEWPPCKTVFDVRSFLGTCGVMRVFIKNFSHRAKPLVRLTQKDVEFDWQPEHQQAMDDLKTAVAESSALVAIDYTCDREVILAIDTASIAVGYILFQMGEDQKRHPARFGSIALNAREARYSQPKLELYGLFRALKEVKIYIVGVKKLVVEMDASCVKGMLNNPDIHPGASINRWIAAIKLFDFDLVHVPATDHKGPDGLSRRTPTDNDDCEAGEEADQWIDTAYNFSLTQVPHRDHVHAPAPLHCFNLAEEPSDDVAAEDAIVIPRDKRAQDADMRIELVEQYLRAPLDPLPLPADSLKGFIRYTSDFFIFDDRLWRRGVAGAHQLVVAPDKRLNLLQQAHDALGHKGKYPVRKHLLLRFWWPYLDSDVAWYDDTCLECQKRRTRHIIIPPTVAYPAPLFRKIYVDTMHMPMANKFKYIVHGRCSLTGWPEWRALVKENAQTIGRWLFEDILCRWGAIEEIVTDNAPQFLLAAQWLVDKYGVHHIKITPYNSRANGVIERPHYNVREAIVKTAGSDIAHWYKYAPYVFWAERVTTKRSTGHSPFYMAHGVEALLPFDVEEATHLLAPVTGPVTSCGPASRPYVLFPCLVMWTDFSDYVHASDSVMWLDIP
jgi:hypothetical protein